MTFDIHHATGDEITFSRHRRGPVTLSTREIEGWLDRMDDPDKPPVKTVEFGTYSLERDDLNWLMQQCADAGLRAAWGETAGFGVTL